MLKRDRPLLDLIGLCVRVEAHTDPGLEGVSGVVLDESENSIMIELKDGRRKRILKRHGVFKFFGCKNNDVVGVLPGFSIVGHPADRVKRLKRGFSR